MTCPKCGDSIDGKLLHCPRCLAQQSHQAVLKLQKGILAAAAGDSLKFPPFRLIRRIGRLEWHIEMLGYRGQAFCGVVFESPRKKKREWERQTKPFAAMMSHANLCMDCQQALADKMKEITAEVA